MRSLHSNANQGSLLGALHCDADLVSDLIASDEKILVRERCSGVGINIIDCHCADLDDYINDVGGLNFANKLHGGISPRISSDLTVVPREWFDRSPDTIDGDIVGIRLGDILSDQPKRKWGTLRLNDDVHVDLSALSKPIFQGKRIVLFGSDTDVVIEGLWWRRHAIGLFEAIAAGNFYSVTSMNFSLFMHECPLAHLININKSLQFCSELCKLGVPVIPHVYAVNDHQRVKWVDLLNQHKDIQTVVINTQLQRDKYSMHEVELTVAELLAKTDVSIVLNGREPKWRDNIPDGKGRIFIANQQGLKRRAIIENAILKLEVSSAQ
jgi:hypothetical protein